MNYSQLCPFPSFIDIIPSVNFFLVLQFVQEAANIVEIILYLSVFSSCCASLWGLHIVEHKESGWRIYQNMLVYPYKLNPNLWSLCNCLYFCNLWYKNNIKPARACDSFIALSAPYLLETDRNRPLCCCTLSIPWWAPLNIHFCLIRIISAVCFLSTECWKCKYTSNNLKSFHALFPSFPVISRIFVFSQIGIYTGDQDTASLENGALSQWRK